MLALAAVLTALTAAAPAPAEPAAKQLTIYVSLPFKGAGRPQSLDIADAIKLALRERDFKAGGHRLELKVFDDSTAAAGQWDAAQVKANAREAAQDDRAIAYIGEFNSGATANSLPTLNEAGILQVSPSNTAAGLTRSGPGSEPGEPEKYYPTGRRTYGRVVPIDDTQARAQVALMKAAGVRRLLVLDDKEVYGTGVAAYVRRAAKRAQIKVVGHRSWNGRQRYYRNFAQQVLRKRPDAVFAGGIVDNNVAQLFTDLYNADRSLALFGPDGVATVDFTRDLPPDVQRAVTITAPTVAPSDLPPAGQRFYRRFMERYRVDANEIDPYAVYGYAAADAVLDAIERGGDDRRAVVKAFFRQRQADSVLGPFSIDANGDTTLRLYGAYEVVGGRLVYRRALRP